MKRFQAGVAVLSLLIGTAGPMSAQNSPNSPAPAAVKLREMNIGGYLTHLRQS